MCSRRRLLLTLAVGFVACFHARAQNATSPRGEAGFKGSGGAASQAERPAINFQVLRQWRVNAGDHAIILNRVAPPVLPPAPPRPLPPSADEIAAAEAFEARQPVKKSVVLFLSATVYDRKVTEVRWFNSQGECKIFSNIDFNLLSGLGGFETPGTSYTLLMGLGNETRAERLEYNRSLTKEDLKNDLQLDVPPLPSEFSPARAEYIVAEDGAHKPPTAEDLTALNALHVYFDANRQRLADKYVKRQAARVERERWLKAHPPVPKDIVVNYWRKPNELPKAEGAK